VRWRTAVAAWIVIVGVVVVTIAGPSVASASSRIAFSRGGDVFTARPDGSGLRLLADRASYEHLPTWSPDHRRLAFLTWDRRVVIVDADGTDRRPLYRLPRRYEGITGLAWSPDGTRIAFASSREKDPVDPVGPKDCGQIWWMWASGGPVHNVIRGEPHVTGIAWSPDGAWLAIGFEHQNMTRACGDDRPMGIARVRLDGSGLRGLGPDMATLPDWFPDGRWIVYRDWRRTCHICGELWIIRPDGTDDHVLTPVPAARGGLTQPRYAPSGHRLIALGDGIWLIDADGSRLRRIVSHAESIDW
jgi:Tol biopolymer transport system component